MLQVNERLKIASVLLSYPYEDFQEVVHEARLAAEEAGDAAVLAAVNGLSALSSSEIIRCYVATFDMQESTALYVTSHELGDSRERGGALLRLHALLRSAAFEPLNGELPDYLPLLLEFLAEKPLGMPTEDLEFRVGVVCRAIYERLDENHPYRPVFALCMECLPGAQPEQQGDKVNQSPAQSAIEPDLDNLPYPLVYA